MMIEMSRHRCDHVAAEQDAAGDGKVGGLDTDPRLVEAAQRLRLFQELADRRPISLLSIPSREFGLGKILS
jgi:hypothetical protein